MPCLLGIDIGTGSVKLGLFDSAAGAWVRVYRRPVDEANARDCWAAVQSVISEAARQDPSSFREIVAISITGQMRGVVVVDHEGEPLLPPITLYDRRAGEQAREFVAEFGLETMYRITGQRFDPTTTAAKLRWLHQHHRSLLDRARGVMAHKDYVRYRMTGQLLTDATDASGWLLYDLRTGAWHDALCRFTGVKRAIMPQILASSAGAGRLRPEVARALDLPADAVVVVGAGDDIAITGSGAHRAGDVGEHLGSTGSVFAVASEPVLDLRMIIECYPSEQPGLFWVGGSCSNGGAAIQGGLQAILGEPNERIDWAAVRNALCNWDRPGPSGWPLWLPYINGERCPVWSEAVRSQGVDLMSLRATAPGVLSIFDGVACLLAWIMRELERCGVAGETVFSSGQAGEDVDFARLRASHYGRTVTRLDQGEATLFGAVLLAAVSVGLIDSPPAGLRKWSRPLWKASPQREFREVLRQRLECMRECTMRMLA